MSYFSELYKRPVMAEPFKSEWRKEQERRRAEEKLKPVVIAKKS